MERTFRSLGMWSFIVFGFTQVLSGIALILFSGYLLSFSFNLRMFGAALSIIIAIGMLGAVLGMIIMSIGPRFRRGS